MRLASARAGLPAELQWGWHAEPCIPCCFTCSLSACLRYRYDEQFSADEKKAARDIKKSCNLNLAAAHLKLDNPAEARKAADKVGKCT